MKHILSTIIMPMMMISASYGVTLCKRSNTAVAILNKVVAGTVDNVNTSGTKWVVNMTDGTIVKGQALCSVISGDFAVVNTGVAAPDSGVNCYCKMMAPATSYWVNASGASPYATASACESACTGACATYVATNQTFRSAVYEAVW